jgi:hypothetical protein
MRVASAGEPLSDALNLLRGTLIDNAVLGPDVHLYVRLDSGERIAVTRKNTGVAVEQPGAEVRVGFAPEDGILFAVSEAV